MPKAASTNGRKPRSARNDEYTDRDFLLRILDVIERDGEATTTTIGRAFGFNGDDPRRTPAVKVASRLVAMRRGRLLESTRPDHSAPYVDPGDHDLRWSLTPKGRIIASGKLSKAAQTALERADEGSMIMMLSTLMRRAWIDGDDADAFAARRQTQHDLAQRKRLFR